MSEPSIPDFPVPEPADMVFGVDSFGDVTVTPDGRRTLSHAETIRNLVAEAQLADSVGIDAITIGEHHREDYAVSSPETVLAAIASTTERIRLASGVTVLSSDDPVRVFERFSTVDAISNGRAEIIVGRGSFTESFPLFGLPLSDYEVLFEEKLQLWAELAKGGPVTWQGSVRTSLTDQQVYPPLQPAEDGTPAPFPTWVAVGGSPQSVVRAASYDFPLMLAIIGGSADRFEPFARIYRQAQAHFGHELARIGFHSPGHIAETDELAREQMWPHYKVGHARVGRERGWPEMTRDQFEHEVDHGALLVGSPETVARRIADGMSVLGAERFDLKYSNGPLPHEWIMSSIELYGTEVIPRVRELLS
ncbi:MAG: LLM class flavin-dependent oxidoreductase [Gulosibacter sp.]|uniref:LLM class flavin-dependent oxidoreductase n=1 Tax=Gulosibacter sp. TaxID=2817531 RepID=UPI003F8F9DE7